MRWLKHLTMAHADREMDAVLDIHGNAAYGVWWLLLEDIAAPMEAGKMDPSATHSMVVWASICRGSVRGVASIFKTLADHRLIVMESTGNRITITVPNLLKYKDEYSKKSGHSQEPKERESRERLEGEGEQREKPAPAPRSASPKPIPPDAEQRIRALADQAPDQQDYERGVNRAMQEVVTSGNPAATLAKLEEHLPLWFAAMGDGRAKIKLLGYVIQDRDYLRKPREPAAQRPISDPIARRQAERREALLRD